MLARRDGAGFILPRRHEFEAFDADETSPGLFEAEDAAVATVAQKISGLSALNPNDAMSALPPKADIAERHRDVRFVPKADIGADEKKGRP